MRIWRKKIICKHQYEVSHILGTNRQSIYDPNDKRVWDNKYRKPRGIGEYDKQNSATLRDVIKGQQKNGEYP